METSTIIQKSRIGIRKMTLYNVFRVPQKASKYLKPMFDPQQIKTSVTTKK